MKRRSKFLAVTAMAIASSFLMSSVVFAEEAEVVDETAVEDVAEEVAESEAPVVAANAVYVNGKALENEFFTVKNVTMVPLVETVEALGFDIKYNFPIDSFTITMAEDKTCTINYKFPHVVMEPALASAYYLEVDPVAHNNVTYLPVKFFADIFGEEVVKGEDVLYIGSKEVVEEVTVVALTEEDANTLVEVVKGTEFTITINQEPAEGYWAVLLEGLNGAFTLVEVDEPVKTTEEAAEATEVVPAKAVSIKDEDVPAESQKKDAKAIQDRINAELAGKAPKTVDPEEEGAEVKAPVTFTLKANKVGEYKVVVSHPVTEVNEEVVSSYVFDIKVVADGEEEVVPEEPAIEAKGTVYTEKNNNGEFHGAAGQPFSVVLKKDFVGDKEVSVKITSGFATYETGKNANGDFVFIFTPDANSRVEAEIVDADGNVVYLFTTIVQ